jgi:hypothetical protein
MITGYHEKLLVFGENFPYSLDPWWVNLNRLWNDAVWQNTPGMMMGMQVNKFYIDNIKRSKGDGLF